MTSFDNTDQLDTGDDAATEPETDVETDDTATDADVETDAVDAGADAGDLLESTGGTDSSDALAFDPETGEVLSPADGAGDEVAAESPADLEAPDAQVIDAEDLIAEAPVVDSPADRPGKWFVVHTQSGYEKKVKQNLEARTQSMNMEGRIHEVVIPMEEVIEFKGGKKVVAQKKMFPGYLLVRCHLDDDSWYVIRNTPGVTGFVGQGTKPSPLRRKEVETFLSAKPEGEDPAATRKGRPRLEFEMGETVRVKEGPFADFSGEIVEINEDQLKVKVLVNIFGRETPVELEFSQVAKL